MSKKTWLITGGLLLGASAAVYFLVIKKKAPISDKYGNLKLKATGKDKSISGGISGGVQTSKINAAAPAVEPDWNNPFDMQYADDVKKWVSPKPVIFLKDQFAKQYAKKIYDAKGGLLTDDDEDGVGNLFSKVLHDKLQVANMSKAFYALYKRDLYDYLASFLSEDELEKYVLSPMRNLPNYRLA